MKPEMLELILKKSLDLVEAGKLVKQLVDSGETEQNIKTWLNLSVNLDMIYCEDAVALTEIFFEGATKNRFMPEVVQQVPA